MSEACGTDWLDQLLEAERRVVLPAAGGARASPDRVGSDPRRGPVAQGATRLGIYECRASTAWARVSLWEFPDLELLTRMVDALSAAAYYQYFAEENAFGRRSEDPYGNFAVAADATAAFEGG